MTLWTIEKGGRPASALPRSLASCWNELDRRRSPFRDGGEFWVQGAALTRIGAPEDAERHYRNGFYQCERREWAVEAAECLRSSPPPRGRAATLPRHAHTSRRPPPRRSMNAASAIACAPCGEIDELPADPPARANDYLSRDELPAAADRA
ncbi:MAG: hypothetical protein U0360_00610 [Dehalococcoidia bacterium]